MSKLYFYIMFILLVPCFAGVKPGTELGNESGLTQPVNDKPVNDKIDTKKSAADKKKNKRGWRNTLIAGGVAGLGIAGLTALMLSHRDVAATGNAAEAQPKVAAPIPVGDEFWNYCMYSNSATQADNQAALFEFVENKIREHCAQLNLARSIVFTGYCSGTAYHEGQIVERLGDAVGKVILVDREYDKERPKLDQLMADKIFCSRFDQSFNLGYEWFVQMRANPKSTKKADLRGDVFFMHNAQLAIIYQNVRAMRDRQAQLDAQINLTDQINERVAQRHSIIFYTFTDGRDEFAVKFTLQDWLFFKSCVDEKEDRAVNFFDEIFLARALKARAQGRLCNCKFDAVLAKLDAFDGRANTNIRRFINFITQ